LSALPGIEGAIVYAVLGLVAGSFATAASHRLPLDKPLAADRSRCANCDHILAAVDLVPVLSWLVAHGKCRYCATPISIRYPVIELAMAGLFVGAWLLGGNDDLTAALLALTALGLTVIVVADLEARIIPDKALIALLPVAIAWRWHTGGNWLDGIGGAILGSGVLYGLRSAFMALRGQDALGLGDVKFVGLAGLYVGASGLAPFFLIGGLIGIAFGVMWRILGRGAIFPFGPALCVAVAVMVSAPGWFDQLFLAAN
jgi:prepilin signal peptidase PulO-like enzyme (type II secretory pathway)